MALDDAHDGPAGDELEHAGAGGKSGKKAHDQKTTLIVLLSLVGVVIAWLSYRSSRAAAGSATGLGAAAPTPLGGSVAGSAGTSSDAQSGLAALLSNLSAELAGLQSGGGAGSSGAGGGIPTSPSDVPQFVRFVNAPGQPDPMHGTVYSIENGNAHALTNQEWRALGTPGFDTVTTQDSRWQTVQQSLHAPPPITPPVVHSGVRPQ